MKTSSDSQVAIRSATATQNGERGQDVGVILDALRSLVRELRLASREAEQRVGVHGAQLHALRQLADNPATSLTELAERVVVVEGVDKDRALPLGPGPMVIGRGADCTLSLSDEYSSTRHARLVPQDGQWFVEDLGSTNGTYVAGQRITRSTALGPKTPIKVGRTVLELRK